ncbi:MAG TPA: hypothetical protein VEF33_05160 [Syntrophales bacterium]|nr:hypothetical protein [Syntrophales bacterium]
MKQRNKEVTTNPKIEVPYNVEEKNLGSSLSKYFKGKAGPLPLKGIESSIISALSIYFQGQVKF